MFKNALVSVSDKTGLVEFLKPYTSKGLRVVSTGGTLKHLRENGIHAIDISEQTGFPEVMAGRVKTLHPRVHMAILSRHGVQEDDDLLKKEHLEPFDLVIVNLYPFEQARAKGIEGEELIEFIDIGGPSLLRAAAKNHDRLAVVCQPSDYAWIAQKTEQKTELTLQDRRRLAASVFKHTSSYDDLIAKTLATEDEKPLTLSGSLVTELRYGENPQQKAWWMKDPAALPGEGLHNAQILHGKPLSYNNILDLDAAVHTVTEFDEPCVVAVKHNNPCGVGTDTTIEGATKRALAADPVSVFGGIVAFNREVDEASAEALAKIFLECVIAPSFSPKALERLTKKKDLRLLAWPKLASDSLIALGSSQKEYRSILGGYLVQTTDHVGGFLAEWKVIGETPTPEIKRDLMLAWKVCARLKSNAIAIAAGGQTVGLGMGQVNRVDAVEHAISRMQKHSSTHVTGNAAPCLASDAFFPFADSIERIAEAGIRWVIQPGGSIRDEEVLAKARERGVNIGLTGRRHFRH